MTKIIRYVIKIKFLKNVVIMFMVKLFQYEAAELILNF